MTDKNEILANFQALSGIEDIVICLDILEQKGWDLTAAVNSVLPDTPQPIAPSLQPRGPVASNNGTQPQSGFVDLTRSPLSSSHAATVNFSIPTVTTSECSLGVYYQGRCISLQLPTTTTIAELKQKLEEETGLPPARQCITGWPVLPNSEQNRLCDLHLPNRFFHVRLENQPQLEPTRGAGPGHSHGRVANDSDMDIVALEDAIDGTRNVPEPAPDPPITVESSPASSISGDACDDLSNDEGDGTESISFYDDTPMDESQRALRESLIPEHCTDPVEALQHFTRQFELRYGSMHPLFFVGSLTEAVREATAGRLNYKPMLIYLHHDASILSNVFCSELLCKESIVSYLTSNYITWAWDLTNPHNRKLLLDMIASCFGPVARSNVDDIHSDQLPVILIILKSKGTVDIRNIIQGEVNIDALMASLMNAVEENQSQMEMDRKEEEERLARVRVIAEQNRAYQESLQADQEKMKQKEAQLRAEEAQLRAEEEEKQEKEAIRQSMASVVPQEPAPDCPEKLSTLRIRLPDGSTTQRRFLGTHIVQDLLNYFGSMDYPVHEYKVLTGFPRMDLTQEDPSQTLEQVGLCPQQTLFLEER